MLRRSNDTITSRAMLSGIALVAVDRCGTAPAS